MGMISCPYCNMEISLNAVEAEDGYCPECGAVITSRSILMADAEDDVDDDSDDAFDDDEIADVDLDDIEDLDEELAEDAKG